MSKQTAIETFVENLEKGCMIYLLTSEDLTYFKKLIEQAKEMERSQIIDACDYGIKLYVNDPITSEDYYNETYKKEQ